MWSLQDSFWNSIETVSRFNRWMVWLAAIFTVFAAIFGVLVILSGNRKDELQKRQEAQAREQEAKAAEALKKQLEAAEKDRRRRTLTAEQRERIAGYLKQVTLPNSVNIMIARNDSEAFAFSEDIQRAFEEGGWRVENRLLTTFGMPMFGLYVGLPPRDEQKEPHLRLIATQAATALANAGYDVQIINDSTQARGTVVIIVGTKP